MGGWDSINWAVVGPLVAIQALLVLVALIACIRAESTQGPKWMWVLIILCGNILGIVAFFIIGRRQQ